ncbi:aldo/keto reductase [Belnapia sp. T18]|uniref:Aldo/keto reductase n=1 Tax=Belnapia arida TaxID=2804533 RepID=A0ABS1U4R8_9PROT|nr:aldo/keto reductase [Belnapia arida]MBL6079666.1 aldo/keto reductase [Belnapia arida]
MSRWRPRGPLGLGGAPLGNLFAPIAEEVAEAAIEAAWDGGIRLYDTAPLYGLGLSEHRMGRVLRRKVRDEFTLCTKVGRLLEADPAAPYEQHGFFGGLPFRVRYDYSAEATLRSIEHSLARLGLARLDMVLIHDAAEDPHGPAWPERFAEAMAGAAPALTRLREQGVIRAWGLGVNNVEPCLLALEHADPDLFLIAGRYTLLDHGALERLIPACAARGASLVIGGPYNSGLLAGGNTFNYAPAPAELLARRDRLAEFCTRQGVPLKAAALQFCAAPKVVAAVIPGGRTPAEVEENARLMAHPIPPGFWGALREAGLIPPGAPVPGG